MTTPWASFNPPPELAIEAVSEAGSLGGQAVFEGHLDGLLDESPGFSDRLRVTLQDPLHGILHFLVKLLMGGHPGNESEAGGILTGDPASGYNQIHCYR